MATSPSQVRALTKLSSSCELVPFISAAGCILERVSGCTSAISQECLDIAEAWLAAHLVSISPVGASSLLNKSEKFEAYSVERAISDYDGQGVLSTTYGMTANAILGGCLGEVDKREVKIAFFG